MASAKFTHLTTMAIQTLTSRSFRRRCQTLFPVVAIAVALGCTLVLFNTGSSDDGKQRYAALSPSSAPIYSTPSTEAFEHADDYLKNIDKAMHDGIAVLRGGDHTSIASQSRYFNALVNAGYAQFGSSYYDPLGSCGVTGSSARHLWHTQIRALGASQGQYTAGEISKARATLQRDRQACLDAVQLPLEEAISWAPTALPTFNLVPTWQNSGSWLDSTAERSSTNL